ncbi:MAG: hypothetical protein AAGG02_09205 [Cyanobacteria bacterium P01_H01_bin.15]
MNHRRRSTKNGLGRLFGIVLLVAIALYILRGTGLLSFLPGALVLVPMIVAIFMGLLWGIKQTNRY